jgi:hypothetical protein
VISDENKTKNYHFCSSLTICSALDLGDCFDNVSELEHVSGLVLAAVYLQAACLFRQLSNHLDRSFLYLFYVLPDYQQTQAQPVTQV